MLPEENTKILAPWIHHRFCHFNKARILYEMSTGTQMILFCQGGYTLRNYVVYLVAILHMFSPPQRTIRASCVGKGERVRWTAGNSSDKITKWKHLLLHSFVPNSVCKKDTNLKQLLVSPCVFKTQRRKCHGYFKGTRLDFNKKQTRKTHTESITVEQTCDLSATFQVKVWGRFSSDGSLLGLPLSDLQDGFYWDHLVVEGLTEVWCSVSQSFPTILNIFLLTLLWEIPSPVLLSLFHLPHFTLTCCFCLPQVVPKLPYSSTQDSGLFLLPFRFRKSLFC